MAVQPRPASTVMLLRDSTQGQGIEVFMVRRVVQSEFMPDVYVFPGGSVTADDRVAEETAGTCALVSPGSADPEGRTALGSGVRAAAIREMFEEANVLLAYAQGQMLALDEQSAPRFAGYRQAFNERKGSLVQMCLAEQLMLATDRLAYFAHWITPEIMPKRFDTHFFLAAAPQEQEAVYDKLETSDGVWIQPAEALTRSKAKDFPIAFPTYHQLRDLSALSSVQAVFDSAKTRFVPTYLPAVMTKKDGPYVYLPQDTEHTWKV